MKRYFISIGLLFAIIFTLIHFATSHKTHVRDQVPAAPKLSDTEKSRIRDFWTVYNLATDARLKGDWDTAASAYEQALVLNPDHKDALYYGGNVDFELGNFTRSESLWRHLIEVNPLSNRAHAQLGLLYSCGLPGTPFDPASAEAEFLESHALNKSETGTLIRLGGVLILAGRFQEADSYLIKALQTNSHSIEGYFLAGFLRWQDGDSPAAARYWQRARDEQQQRGKTPGVTSRERYGPRCYFSTWLDKLQTQQLSDNPVGGMEEIYASLQSALTRIGTDKGRGKGIDTRRE